MTAALPEGIDTDDEIAIIWATDDDGITRVTASIGTASVMVETDDEGVHLVPWLVASMPQVLEAAWSQIEQQEPTTDAQEAP